MTKNKKLHKILNWYAEVNQKETKQLARQESFEQVSEVEALVEETLPQDIRDFFCTV